MQESPSRDDDAEVNAAIELMTGHVQEADPRFRPGDFWASLLETNIAMISEEGIKRLKRHVGNNYFNWIFSSPRDPQVINAVRKMFRYRAPQALAAKCGDASGLRTMTSPDRQSLTRFQRRLYSLCVAMAWEEALRSDKFGLTADLEEPSVGDPITVSYRGRLTTQDLANSVVECSYGLDGLRSCTPPVEADDPGLRVAELGAGYGRLAFVFAQRTAASYFVFDIPPALATAEWYLSETLGSNRVMSFSPEHTSESIANIAPGQVALFTPDQLELFPNRSFSLCQSISTLPEMPESQALMYLDLLAAKSSAGLFMKQWISWRNEADGVEFSEDRYEPGPEWKLVDRRTDPVQPMFFNRFWARVPQP
ncbi:MAG: putative sugar O-methyltransferase [Solirubrobacterales bacterium]